VAPRACDGCVARTWLIGRMAGHIDRARARIEAVLELADDELVAALGGRERDALRYEFGELDLGAVRALSDRAGLQTICACDAAYPRALRGLAAPPAVLHVAGDLSCLLALADTDPVAVVGSRRASEYGLGVARALGRGLGLAGLPVISGMALGIDSAAHAGALAAGASEVGACEGGCAGGASEAGACEGGCAGGASEAIASEAGGLTVAVLPGSADRPYPAGQRALHRRILAGGLAVSEIGPETGVRRWMFLARNRIIAALSTMTVVVEAREYSGALVTARVAGELGRPVGAVPGRVTTPQAAGSNGLLAAGAYLVRGPQDVLDHLFGAGVRRAADPRGQPPAELRPLLVAVAEGHDTVAALARAGFDPERGLTGLAALELTGHVRRGLGGRFTVAP
jgi:DNA processing protein